MKPLAQEILDGAIQFEGVVSLRKESAENDRMLAFLSDIFRDWCRRNDCDPAPWPFVAIVEKKRLLVMAKHEDGELVPIGKLEDRCRRQSKPSTD